MKVLYAFCLLALLAIVAALPAENKYTTRFDNVDVDRILKNDRILANYIKCLMEEGPCTPDGRELKVTLPDALQSGCTKCSDKQKDMADKVIRHLVKARPSDWARLMKKYDPEGEYKSRYSALATEKPGRDE